MKNIIYLDGLWELRLDPDKKGIDKCFFGDDFENLKDCSSIMLPGIIEHTQYAEGSTKDNSFCGYAWYQRKVVLSSIESQNIKLFLERTCHTMVWINGVQANGICKSLSTPHTYEIASLLRPGVNTITIMADNSFCSQNTHILNGIGGEISLHSYESCHAENIRIFPNIADKNVRVVFQLVGANEIELSAFAECGESICREQTFTVRADENGLAEFIYLLGDSIHLWSEYSPNVWTMNINFFNGDKENIDFGIREFKVNKTGFEVNGKPVFLRGRRCSGIFPFSPKTPADTEIWTDIFRTEREYGINYYRFDSYCPPEAAFKAADAMGIYLHPTIPIKFCGSEYAANEGLEILKTFGNHPSFCMFSPDDTNNSIFECEMLKPYMENDDRHAYFSSWTESPKIRCIYDKPAYYPSPDIEEKCLTASELDEMKALKKRLTENGLLDRWKKFSRASERFEAYCCKTKIEDAMLDENLVGFEIVTSPKICTWNHSHELFNNQPPLRFCSDKALLSKTNSTIITGNRFTAEIFAGRCNREAFSDDYIGWELCTNERIIDGGELTAMEKGNGLVRIGVIDRMLPENSAPYKLTLTLTAKETENNFTFWVFPDSEAPQARPGTFITENTAEALDVVKKGGRVLLISDKVKTGVPYEFPDDSGFRPTAGLMSGLLISNNHEALSMFPSESYFTPQWRSIVKSGVSAILDDAPTNFHPIVETIDNYMRCHKLGILFEAKVLYGKLMMCTLSLESLMKTIEGKWFLRSISEYCGSENFRPSCTLSEDYIKSIFE